MCSCCIREGLNRSGANNVLMRILSGQRSMHHVRWSTTLPKGINLNVFNMQMNKHNGYCTELIKIWVHAAKYVSTYTESNIDLHICDAYNIGKLWIVIGMRNIYSVVCVLCRYLRSYSMRCFEGVVRNLEWDKVCGVQTSMSSHRFADDAKVLIACYPIDSFNRLTLDIKIRIKILRPN